jgi:hypothetical protein
MNEGKRQIRDALLERYLADALDVSTRANIETVLKTSEADQMRLSELRADSAAFLTQHPPGPLVARFEGNQFRLRRWRFLSYSVATVVCAAAALLLYFKRSAEDSFGAKGAVGLSVYKKAADGALEVGPDTTLSAGDEIRFKIEAPAARYVAVISRDAQGNVTVYYPFRGLAAEPYEPANSLLPAAVSLDAVTGNEDLYALAGPDPFRVESVVDALKSGRPLQPPALPAGVSFAHTTLLKRSR